MSLSLGRNSHLHLVNLQSPPSPRPAAPVCDEAATCDECGAFGAYALDGATLCLACYANRGSCCAEAGDARGHAVTCYNLY